MTRLAAPPGDLEIPMLGTTTLAALLAFQGGDLPVDPASLLLWREAVDLVSAHEAEIWPGYRLAEIPALVTHPKVGEILTRHPKPPFGFAPLDAARVPESLRGEPFWIRLGTTVFSVPQETSTDLGGFKTLVVSDRKALDAPDDVWCLAVVVHEGFHAWAATKMKLAPSNEMDLADFPDLDPDVNAHLELEGFALEAAVRAETSDEAEDRALVFLAERQRRRARMPAATIAWEDGNELNEGLATYVEWRAYDLWAKQGVGAPLLAALPQLGKREGFTQRSEQVLLMLRNLARGTMSQNGSNFGAAVVRARGYRFGAAVGRLLDHMGGDWKQQVARGSTLTGLLREALGEPDDKELSERADAAEKEADYPLLVKKKNSLVVLAVDERKKRIAAVTEGTSGTLVEISVAGLSRSGPLLPSSYTPFGILRVDADRRLFSMAPTSFEFGSARIVTPEAPGVIVDEKARTLTTRSTAPADELVAAFASYAGSYSAAGLTIDAPVATATKTAAGAVRVELATSRPK
jgi:hypothetical protein